MQRTAAFRQISNVRDQTEREGPRINVGPIAMTKLVVSIGYDNDNIVSMLKEVYGLPEDVARSN
jgi:hypothetical protein